MQENKFFVVFKKSIRKHIFKNFKCFFLYIYKKNVQNMLEYWSYATHKKFFYIYIFATFHGKTGYFNTRFVFPQYKKITKP